MLLLGQGPGGAVSARNCAPLKFAHQNPVLFSNATTSKPRFILKRQPLSLTLVKAKAEGRVDATSAAKQPLSNNNNPTHAPPPSFSNNDTVFVGQEDVPLEGVIQFEKPSSSSSRLDTWGLISISIFFS